MKLSNLRSSILLLAFGLAFCPSEVLGQSFFRGRQGGNHNGRSVVERKLQSTPEEEAAAWAEMAPVDAEIDAQQLSMATFYFATGGAWWLNQTNWLSYDVDECEWFNYADPSCDIEGSLIQLNITMNNITGTIPTEIGMLSDLTLLSLDNNTGLTGTMYVMVYLTDTKEACMRSLL